MMTWQWETFDYSPDGFVMKKGWRLIATKDGTTVMIPFHSEEKPDWNVVEPIMREWNEKLK